MNQENLKPETMDWKNIGFDYIKTDYRYMSKWKDGEWDEGNLVEDNQITIHEGSPVFHYGQHCFEGLKAYRTKDGDIQLFRVDENARRMAKSCARLMMPTFPEERFIEAVKETVRANEDWVPPYGTGASLYIRPYMIGTGANIGVQPAKEYIFSIFVIPVGAYFKGGLTPNTFIVTEYDRAAPNGTGAAKAGGNYGGSLLPGNIAKTSGYSDVVYLDPKSHTKIEEVGAANFFAITNDDVFVTPKSASILPSITKSSLLYLASEYLDMEVREEDIYIDKLDDFKEAGAMGTAAVIAPVGGLMINDDLHVFHSQEEAGPITKKLYELISGIQFGDVKAPEGWIFSIYE